MTNPEFDDQGRHHVPPYGQPQDPYSTPAGWPSDQPQYGSSDTPAPPYPPPPVTGPPVSGPPTGYPPTRNYPSVPPAQPPKKKVGKTGLIIGIIAAFLVLCCGGTAIAAAVSGGGKPKPAPAVVATTNGSPTATASPSPSPSPTLASPSAVVTTAAAAVATTQAPAPPPPPPATTKAAPPPPPPGGPPTHSGYITPGAFCKVAEIGWVGYSAAGKEYVCRRPPNGTQPHWEVP